MHLAIDFITGFSIFFSACSAKIVNFFFAQHFYTVFCSVVFPGVALICHSGTASPSSYLLPVISYQLLELPDYESSRFLLICGASNGFALQLALPTLNSISQVKKLVSFI